MGGIAAKNNRDKRASDTISDTPVEIRLSVADTQSV